MSQPIRPDHPLYQFVYGHVTDEVKTHVSTSGLGNVEQYITELLLEFLRTESLFSLQDNHGQPLQSVIEMVGLADVRLSADSFEREREVHKHIGDFILFWTGVAPDALGRYRASKAFDISCDYLGQGRESYYLVSTFDYSPFDNEAPLFRRMSEMYDSLAFVVNRVAHKTGLYPAH